METDVRQTKERVRKVSGEIFEGLKKRQEESNEIAKKVKGDREGRRGGREERE